MIRNNQAQYFNVRPEAIYHAAINWVCKQCQNSCRKLQNIQLKQFVECCCNVKSNLRKETRIVFWNITIGITESPSNEMMLTENSISQTLLSEASNWEGQK